MIVPVSREAHHMVHLDPILAHLPHANSRRYRSDVALVASYGSLRVARRQGFTRFVLAQHGAGQSYGGDKKRANHPSYPGGSDNRDVGLFLVPNEHAARRWRQASPQASVAIVGSPRLDVLPKRVGDGGPVVAVSFHWDDRSIPEMRNCHAIYMKAVHDLSKRFTVIGHGHPHDDRKWARFWRALRIPFVQSFQDVCLRADLYVCDNSSTIFEFASTGRPVVVLNQPAYRRDVEHGLRFWEAASVGVQVDDPRDFLAGVQLALDDPSEQQAAREKALSIVYAYRTGAARRAAEAIMAWVGSEAEEAA